MKHLNINTKEYQLILHSYKEWLQTFGYSKKVQEGYPNHVKEFLHHLETNGIFELNTITPDHVQQFAEHLKTRTNATHGGGLSGAQINLIIQAVNKLIVYLKNTKGITIEVELLREKAIAEPIDVLSLDEIKELLNSMDTTQNPVALRDKTIITVLYGAGLRLSETAALNVEDISLTQQSIFVKKGKGNKQRMVPITGFTVEILRTYITQLRDTFADISKTNDEALFIDIMGKRIPYFTYYRILEQRIKLSGVSSLQEKRIHPHLFRHSIATHLFQQGMDMEDIASFLGHSSLDSTMIYAHLAEQIKHTT
jgi:site-specific recombinase XerD